MSMNRGRAVPGKRAAYAAASCSSVFWRMIQHREELGMKVKIGCTPSGPPVVVHAPLWWAA